MAVCCVYYISRASCAKTAQEAKYNFDEITGLTRTETKILQSTCTCPGKTSGLQKNQGVPGLAL